MHPALTTPALTTQRSNARQRQRQVRQQAMKMSARTNVLAMRSQLWRPKLVRNVTQVLHTSSAASWVGSLQQHPQQRPDRREITENVDLPEKLVAEPSHKRPR